MIPTSEAHDSAHADCIKTTSSSQDSAEGCVLPNTVPLLWLPSFPPAHSRPFWAITMLTSACKQRAIGGPGVFLAISNEVPGIHFQDSTHTTRPRISKFNINDYNNHQRSLWIIKPASLKQSRCHNPKFQSFVIHKHSSSASSTQTKESAKYILLQDLGSPIRKQMGHLSPCPTDVPLSAAARVPSSGSPVPLPALLALPPASLQPADGNTAVRPKAHSSTWGTRAQGAKYGG